VTRTGPPPPGFFRKVSGTGAGYSPCPGSSSDPLSHSWETSSLILGFIFRWPKNKGRRFYGNACADTRKQSRKPATPSQKASAPVAGGTHWRCGPHGSITARSPFFLYKNISYPADFDKCDFPVISHRDGRRAQRVGKKASGKILFSLPFCPVLSVTRTLSATRWHSGIHHFQRIPVEIHFL